IRSERVSCDLGCCHDGWAGSVRGSGYCFSYRIVFVTSLLAFIGVYYHHSGSEFLLARASSSISCTPFSLIVNLVWSYACHGESSIIAVLSRPAFLNRILYVEP